MRNKRFLSLMLILCMMCMCLAGCQKVETSKKVEKENGANVEQTRVVTDHLDRKVTVPTKIDRIVVCGLWPLPSVLACFFDSADKIVGIPENCMVAAKNSILGEMYPEILNADTSYTDGTDVNMEELMKLNPDLVITNTTTPDLIDNLEAANIPVVALSVNKWDYNCIETLKQWIKLLSEIFPENDKAAKVADKADEVYELVNSRVKDIPDEEKERVFFLFNYTDSMIATSGNKFFGQWWATAIGGKNVAEEIDKENAAPVNMESIYAWNPSIIFVSNYTVANPSDIYDNTIGDYDWSGIDAVKNKRVYKMPLGMYRSYTPGIDTPITLLALSKMAYPDRFEDIDLISEVKSYYQDLFGIELTDSQANAIFNPAVNAGQVK